MHGAIHELELLVPGRGGGIPSRERGKKYESPGVRISGFRRIVSFLDFERKLDLFYLSLFPLSCQLPLTQANVKVNKKNIRRDFYPNTQMRISFPAPPQFMLVFNLRDFN